MTLSLVPVAVETAGKERNEVCRYGHTLHQNGSYSRRNDRKGIESFDFGTLQQDHSYVNDVECIHSFDDVSTFLGARHTAFHKGIEYRHYNECYQSRKHQSPNHSKRQGPL